MNVFRRLQRATNVLSLRFALGLILASVALTVAGLMLIEDYGFIDAFYTSVITLSTVGFGEVLPLSQAGRLFLSLIIVLNIGIVAYALAAFSYYVIDGKIFQTMQENRVKNRIAGLSGHTIVCGYGRYGREIVSHLALHHRRYVVIENVPEKIGELYEALPDALHVAGDATTDEALEEAGIGKASALITSLRDDTENLFIVISALDLHPGIQVISSAREQRSRRKLIRAGAHNVIMPEQIGGFYMATLVSKPGAVEFFSHITNELASDIGFEEVLYDRLPEDKRDRPISDLHLRRETGVNIIGHRQADGSYVVNPGPEAVLQPGGSYIAVGNPEQLARLKNFLL